MSHYNDAIELTSPVVAQLLGTPDGKLIGKANVKTYFKQGLEAYPNLQFHLEAVFVGLRSVVFLYKNQKGGRTAEFMELSPTAKVTRVVANYSP